MIPSLNVGCLNFSDSCGGICALCLCMCFNGLMGYGSHAETEPHHPQPHTDWYKHLFVGGGLI